MKEKEDESEGETSSKKKKKGNDAFGNLEFILSAIENHETKKKQSFYEIC